MVLDFLNAVARDFGAARSAANDVKRLNRMNNEELAQLGLTRSEISVHAYRKNFGNR